MPSLRDLVIFIADDTIRIGEQIDPDDLPISNLTTLREELGSLRVDARTDPTAAKIIRNLNRIQILATNDLMMGRARSPETQRWLQILRERASDHVMSIILHPDYKPPVSEPPPPPPKN